MYRLVHITLAVILIKISAGDPGESCSKVMTDPKKAMSCCKIPAVNQDHKGKMDEKKFGNKLEECMKASPESEEKECSERDKCVAKVMGLTKDNGDADMDAIKTMYEENVKDRMDPILYEKTKTNCIDHKPKSEEMCYFKYLEVCAQMYFIMGCKEWSDEDSCKEITDHAHECAKQI